MYKSAVCITYDSCLEMGSTSTLQFILDDCMHVNNDDVLKLTYGDALKLTSCCFYKLVIDKGPGSEQGSM